MDNLRKTLGCLLLFLFAAVTSTYAQLAKQYSGTVTDADSNEPVIGVNVTLKDAQTGTVTDLSGKFSISAPVGSTLLFSYIGYVTKEVKLGTNTSLKITMQEDQNQLSEVVVIGYGVVKKSDITGAVASVSISYIDKNGSIIETSLSNRSIAWPLKKYPKTNVVLIATGLSKAEGLKAVLKGGYINTLMISLKLAKAILETE